MWVFKTKWFTRFAAKNGISDRKLKEAIDEVERGIIDADLGGGLVKKRIAREGEGKSGGYRTIIAYHRKGRGVNQGANAFFIYGFPKNELGNISEKDLAVLKDASKQYGALDDTQINAAVVIGKLDEVK